MKEEKAKEKSCVDCLHCKVSAISPFYCFLCFCAMSKKKEIYQEPYWVRKPVCKKFEDMTA